MNHLPDDVRIIVIGASSGGLDAIKTVIAGLPSDFMCPVFIVWHIAPGAQGVVPDVLNRLGTMPAYHAIDKEPILPGRIYIAPPDRHLVLEKDLVRVTKGPKENRFRPAVDPLFRSAAYTYKGRVTGIILSGALSDGTSGLWTIKQKGGLAIVQDPRDAEVPGMPESALQSVPVDYILPASEIARLLIKIGSESVKVKDHRQLEPVDAKADQQAQLEISIALQQQVDDLKLMSFGELSPYTCPECGGVMNALKEGSRTRFRCHTGHAFSSDSLLADLSQMVEDNLWSAVRSIEETRFLLNFLGDHFSAANNPKVAAAYFRRAQDAESKAQMLRNVILPEE